MSAKKTIFPPGRDANQPDPDDDFYTGQPDLGGLCHDQADDPTRPAQGREASKGCAAYAAQDEMPPFTPRGKGFNPLGGLFSDAASAAAGPGGPGVPGVPAGPGGGGASGADGLLSVVTQDALAAECQKRVCPVCQVQKEAEDSRLRALAEVENTKKRLQREREEQVRFAAESVLTDIIPSLDNLELALQHAGNEPACKNLVVGVQMTLKLLLEALAKNGLRPVGGVGEEFNPAVHEAVGMVNAPDVPDGHICALLSSGYTLHNRLLRPARVMVSKKGA